MTRKYYFISIKEIKCIDLTNYNNETEIVVSHKLDFYIIYN